MANYHMSEAVAYGKRANWYAENYVQFLFGESKAEYEGK
jgi:hypothetical protein